MGFMGPFEYKNSKGQVFYLHVKERGKTRVFYFSKDNLDSLSFLPAGFHVVENKKTGMPFLKKGSGGIMDLLMPAATGGKPNQGMK